MKEKKEILMSANETFYFHRCFFGLVQISKEKIKDDKLEQNLLSEPLKLN